MKKLLLLFAAVFFTVTAHAYDLANDGIYYNKKSDGSLEVVGSSTTNVDIPSSFTIASVKYRVTSIGKYAFNGRSDITYLSIPYSIKSIGEYAFMGCGSNITVNIADPESWCKMELGNEHASPLSSAKKMLVHDKETTSFSVPETVTSIGAFTFYQCSCLKTLYIPGSVTSIGSSAFEDCDYLTSLTLSNGLKSIGGSAFEGCVRLTTLSIPSTVTKIKINAFKKCTSLNNITSEIQQPFAIDENVFNTYSTATLLVPAGTKSAYKSTAGWKLFQNIIEPTLVGQKFKINGYYYKIGKDNTVSVTSGDDANYYGDIVIPSQVTYDGTTYSVTSIEKNAFHRNSAITSVTIPNSVTSIGESALGACTKLTTVSIPNSVTEIGPAAFYGCIALKQINLPSRLKRIENNLFWGCNRLTSITIPESVTSIAEEAFRECSALSSITIPNSVTVIGSRAFSDCSILKDITSEIQKPFAISDDVFKGIPSDAVLNVPVGKKSAYQSTAGWKLFKNIIEPSLVGKKIKVNGFYYIIGNDNTVSVTSGDDANYFGDLVIPSQVTYSGTTYSVTSIEKNAFHRNSAITSVTIPNSVTSIGESAFGACTKLTTVSIPNSVTEMGAAAFYGCIALNEINFPSELKRIENNLFWGCTSLTSFAIPDWVTSIAEEAFRECSALSFIFIPNSVTEIGNKAFSGCSSLITIISDIQNPFAISDDVFDGISSEAVLTVPVETKSLYQSTAGWKRFSNIIEPTQVGQTIYVNGYYFKIGNDNTVSVTSGEDANYFGDMVIPSHVTYEGTIYRVTSIEKNAFHRNKAITSVTIPNFVTSIGESAFAGCTGLSSITIPNSVTEIASAAFEECTNLRLIIIGSNVAYIGSRAFANINGELNSRSRAENNILKVICKAEIVPGTASDAFENTQIEQAILIVPDNVVVAYQASAPWDKFGNISGEIEYMSIDGIILDPLEESIYDLQGNRLVNLRKGVNIIKTAHGKVKKVLH